MRMADCLMLGLALAGVTCGASAADWPMLGRTATRNAVSPESNPPTDWDIDRDRNIRWTAELGNCTFGDPVVAGGLVWIGTNNGRPRDPNFSADPAAALMCFRDADGAFLYQYACQALPGRPYHWNYTGHTSSPLVQGERIWFTTIRGEVVCLDVGPLQRCEGPPRELWNYDMVRELGVYFRAPAMGDGRTCSVAAHGNRLYVITGNGVAQEGGLNTVAPDAPSLICLDQSTGALLWKTNVPHETILSGQWGSPLVAEIGGRLQCIAPQGDGWLRSFDGTTGRLLWEFDMNSKTARWDAYGRGTRHFFMNAPVLYEGRIYIASGQNMEAGGGPGRLCGIDPTRSGDISAELAVDAQGRPIPHRRVQAVDPQRGEKAVPNPNSGLLWEFTQRGTAFEDHMHRSKSTVAVARGLVIAADYDGIIHCLDAGTGEKYWSYDTLATIHGSPLIVDGTIYVADEDGEVSVLALARELTVIGEPELPAWVHSSPIFANGTLYLANQRTLYAISTQPAEPPNSGRTPLPKETPR